MRRTGWPASRPRPRAAAWTRGTSDQLFSIKAEWEAAHPRPGSTLAQVADHIEHVREVAGVEHVGLGGDFDGTDEVTAGLEDVSTYPALFAELLRRAGPNPTAPPWPAATSCVPCAPPSPTLRAERAT